MRYERVPPAVLRGLFEEMRGADNHDFIVVVNTTVEEGGLLQCSSLSGEPIDNEIGETLVDLWYWVSDNAPEPEDLNDYAVCFGDDGLNALYLRGEEAVIGVGYLDGACCPKGMMMASLIAYCFALVNLDTDERLAHNAFTHLPFVQEIGLSQSFFTKAERLVFEGTDA